MAGLEEVGRNSGVLLLHSTFITDEIVNSHGDEAPTKWGAERKIASGVKYLPI